MNTSPYQMTMLARELERATQARAEVRRQLAEARTARRDLRGKEQSFSFRFVSARQAVMRFARSVAGVPSVARVSARPR